MHSFALSSGAVSISATETLAHLQVQGLIRIQRWESPMFAARPRLWHFNLGRAEHEPGKLYGVVRILRPGRREPGMAEASPLLDPTGIRLCRALKVEHVASLSAVPLEWLQPSSLPKGTYSGLAASLSAKYAKTNEGLSEALELFGITATLLECTGMADLSTSAALQRAAVCQQRFGP